MIFVALGTCEPFPRILRKIDELAAEMSEEFVVQYGKTEIPLPHCRGFDYAPSLDEFYSAARLVICHAGLGIQLELMRRNQPFIAVPRLCRYKEHFDDHQVETCEYLNLKFGIRYILDMEELTPGLVEKYSDIAPYRVDGLNRFRRDILSVLNPK